MIHSMQELGGDGVQLQEIHAIEGPLQELQDGGELKQSSGTRQQGGFRTIYTIKIQTEMTSCLQLSLASCDPVLSGREDTPLQAVTDDEASPWRFLSQPASTSSAWTRPRTGWPLTVERCRRTCIAVQMWRSPRCRSPAPWRCLLLSDDRRSCSGVWQHIYSDSLSLPTGLSLCHNHRAATKRRGRSNTMMKHPCEEFSAGVKDRFLLTFERMFSWSSVSSWSLGLSSSSSTSGAVLLTALGTAEHRA